jgi:hypothetical protein
MIWMSSSRKKRKDRLRKNCPKGSSLLPEMLKRSLKSRVILLNSMCPFRICFSRDVQ